MLIHLDALLLSVQMQNMCHGTPRVFNDLIYLYLLLKKRGFGGREAYVKNDGIAKSHLQTAL
jgi:hypothetical protein